MISPLTMAAAGTGVGVGGSGVAVEVGVGCRAATAEHPARRMTVIGNRILDKRMALIIPEEGKALDS
jgi:hypothetical protein